MHGSRLPAASASVTRLGVDSRAQAPRARPACQTRTTLASAPAERQPRAPPRRRSPRTPRCGDRDRGATGAAAPTRTPPVAACAPRARRSPPASRRTSAVRRASSPQQPPAGLAGDHCHAGGCERHALVARASVQRRGCSGDSSPGCHAGAGRAAARAATARGWTLPTCAPPASRSGANVSASASGSSAGRRVRAAAGRGVARARVSDPPAASVRARRGVVRLERGARAAHETSRMRTCSQLQASARSRRRAASAPEQRIHLVVA
jgi:hypothetical protein